MNSWYKNFNFIFRSFDAGFPNLMQQFWFVEISIKDSGVKLLLIPIGLSTKAMRRWVGRRRTKVQDVSQRLSAKTQLSPVLCGKTFGVNLKYTLSTFS